MSPAHPTRATSLEKPDLRAERGSDCSLQARLARAISVIQGRARAATQRGMLPAGPRGAGEPQTPAIAHIPTEAPRAAEQPGLPGSCVRESLGSPASKRDRLPSHQADRQMHHTCEWVKLRARCQLTQDHPSLHRGPRLLRSAQGTARQPLAVLLSCLGRLCSLRPLAGTWPGWGPPCPVATGQMALGPTSLSTHILSLNRAKVLERLGLTAPGTQAL